MFFSFVYRKHLIRNMKTTVLLGVQNTRLCNLLRLLSADSSLQNKVSEPSTPSPTKSARSRCTPRSREQGKIAQVR